MKFIIPDRMQAELTDHISNARMSEPDRSMGIEQLLGILSDRQGALFDIFGIGCS